MDDIIILKGPENLEVKIHKYKLCNVSNYSINYFRKVLQKNEIKLEGHELECVTKNSFLSFCNLLLEFSDSNNYDKMLIYFADSYKIIDYTCCNNIVNTLLMYFYTKHSDSYNDVMLFCKFIEINYLIDDSLKQTFNKLLCYYIPRITGHYQELLINRELKMNDIHDKVKDEVLKYALSNFETDDNLYISGIPD